MIRSYVVGGASLLGLLLGAVSGCGGTKPGPDDPSKDPFGGTMCTSVRPQTEPDLMGWDSGSRAKLNRLRNQGVVAVRYKAVGCNVELEVIENCIGADLYRYEAYAASDTKMARNTQEVFAEFPLGVARLGAMVKNGKMLRTDYLMVGTDGLPPDASIKLSDLRGGDCKRATHVVRTVYLGGFAMATGSTSELGGGGSLFGVGAGARTGSSSERVASEGVANACEQAQKDGKKNSLCSVPLRIALLPIEGLPSEDDSAPAQGASGPQASTGTTSPGKRTTGAPSTSKGKPDRDGDGVPDDEDACPDVPGIVSKEWAESGCPKNASESAHDRDGDGIPDSLDKCPDDPEDKDGFQDDDGCPDPDNDADGIPDVKDKCPNQPGPASNGGCPVASGSSSPPPAASSRVTVTSSRIALSERIQFFTARGELNPTSFSLLDELVTVLKRESSVNLSIEGHSDNTGSAALNKKLTQDRADAVKAYLVTKGISAARLTAVGYGGDKPIDTNTTQEGRERNRRIELARR